MRMRKTTREYLTLSADEQVSYVIDNWEDIFPSTIEVSEEEVADALCDYYRELNEYYDSCFSQDYFDYY